MKTESVLLFPANLIQHVDPSLKSTPVSIDRLAGVEYAISTLPEEAQQWIRLRFRQNLSAVETAGALGLTQDQEKALGQDTVQKLRHTSRWDWIQHGIEGNLRRIKRLAEAWGYEEGYRKGLEDGCGGKIPTAPDAAALALPVSALPVSNRILNVLNRLEYTTVASLVDKDEYEVMALRGLGARGVAEIGLALRQLGITGTAWERYIR